MTTQFTGKQRDVIDRLRGIQEQLAPIPQLYVERRRLLRRGKKLGILQRVMADASGLSESAVNKELNKPV